MKKIFLAIIISFFLINIIPAFSFAEEKAGGVQTHTMYALWILLLLFFILFTSIIFFVSPSDKKAKEGKIYINEIKEIPVVMSGSGLIVFDRSIKVISYLVYLLLALYFAIFIFLLV
jgi:hypothetical protein